MYGSFQHSGKKKGEERRKRKWGEEEKKMKNKNKRTRTKMFWFNHFYVELIVMQLLWLIASSPFFSDSGCLTVMMFSVMY